MRAATFVLAFGAASAYAAGVDSTEMFDQATAPQGNVAAAADSSAPAEGMFRSPESSM